MIYWVCDDLSVLGSKFIHVDKRGNWTLLYDVILTNYTTITTMDQISLSHKPVEMYVNK